MAWELLRALGLRERGPEIVACPTCGRTEIELVRLAEAVEERLRGVTQVFTVAVMGCVVGVHGNAALEKQFPFVDVFMEPATDGLPLVAHLQQDDDHLLEQQETAVRHALLDGEVGPAQVLPPRLQAPELLSLVDRVRPEFEFVGVSVQPA